VTPSVEVPSTVSADARGAYSGLVLDVVLGAHPKTSDENGMQQKERNREATDQESTTQIGTVSAPLSEAPTGLAVGQFSPSKFRRLRESLIRRTLQCCAGISVFTSLAILLILLKESLPFFADVSPWDFLTGTNWAPLMEPRHFGVLPLIGGTLLVTGVATIVVIPVGSLTAIFLSEYASERARRIFKPLLEVLAGIPTVVYGYFAIAVVTPALRAVIPGMGVFNALSAGIVVAVMIIPTVASLSDDAMRAVPGALREAAYGLGATKREVSLGVVYPGALSGILAAYVLAIGRALGETMIVTMAAGATPQLTANPLESIQTMTGYIVQVSLGDTPAGTPGYLSIFAVGLTLFVMTLVINLFSFWIKRRYRQSYS
jgi:phosphate transport system permease protein